MSLRAGPEEEEQPPDVLRSKRVQWVRVYGACQWLNACTNAGTQRWSWRPPERKKPVWRAPHGLRSPAGYYEMSQIQLSFRTEMMELKEAETVLTFCFLRWTVGKTGLSVLKKWVRESWTW